MYYDGKGMTLYWIISTVPAQRESIIGFDLQIMMACSVATAGCWQYQRSDRVVV